MLYLIISRYKDASDHKIGISSGHLRKMEGLWIFPGITFSATNLILLNQIID